MELQSLSARRSLSLPLYAAVIALVALLAQPARADDREEISTALGKYVKALYARDFRTAYEQISSADQRLRDVHSYSRARGEFRDFILEAARAVAQSVSVSLLELVIDQEHAVVKVKANVPDATKLNPLMLDWDSERLESLSTTERKTLLNSIDRQRRDKTIALVAGEETFNLVKEAGGWKVFLNWAAGVKLTFQPAIPASSPVEIKIEQSPSRVASRASLSRRHENQKHRQTNPIDAHRPLGRTARAARLSRSGRLRFHLAGTLATGERRRVCHNLLVTRHPARNGAPVERHLRSYLVATGIG